MQWHKDQFLCYSPITVIKYKRLLLIIPKLDNPDYNSFTFLEKYTLSQFKEYKTSMLTYMHPILCKYCLMLVMFPNVSAFKSVKFVDDIQPLICMDQTPVIFQHFWPIWGKNLCLHCHIFEQLKLKCTHHLLNLTKIGQIICFLCQPILKSQKGSSKWTKIGQILWGNAHFFFIRPVIFPQWFTISTCFAT